MIQLGLTGSMAMGKTTTAGLFAKEGAAVFDADAAVHALYAPGGPVGPSLRRLFPDAVGADGGVDRRILRTLLTSDSALTEALEAEVFPLVADERRRFLARAEADGVALAVLDIPLLFETGGETSVDAVVVSTAPPEVQRARVLTRGGMDPATFAMLSARQAPDEDKRRKADFLVYTDKGIASAAAQVHGIVETVLAPDWTPPRRRLL